MMGIFKQINMPVFTKKSASSFVIIIVHYF